MILICNCGKRRAAIQAINAEQATAIVNQQVQVAPMDSYATIVDPDELVHQPH